MMQSFDRSIDPAKIPESGERLDQVLVDAGKSKSWKSDEEGQKEALVIKTVVDNGPRAGKNLSAPFFNLSSMRFAELWEIATGLGTTRDVTSLESAIHILRRFKGNLRFSAMVDPVRYETDQGKYVRYRMTFFTEPENEPEVTPKLEPTQFQR